MAATATAILLLLLTWWASGAADAAQTLSPVALVNPLPISPWWPRWIVSQHVQESGVIASVGSGLIALAACLRRTGMLK
jgi:ABC-type sugar transport system substrate-binding protein